MEVDLEEEGDKCKVEGGYRKTSHPYLHDAQSVIIIPVSNMLMQDVCLIFLYYVV